MQDESGMLDDVDDVGSHESLELHTLVVARVDLDRLHSVLDLGAARVATSSVSHHDDGTDHEARDIEPHDREGAEELQQRTKVERVVVPREPELQRVVQRVVDAVGSLGGSHADNERVRVIVGSAGARDRAGA